MAAPCQEETFRWYKRDLADYPLEGRFDHWVRRSIWISEFLRSWPEDDLVDVHVFGLAYYESD